MKFITNISLIILILLQTVGVTFSRHYCGEILAGWDLSVSGEHAGCDFQQVAVAPACDNQQAEAMEGCCDNEVEYLQMDEDVNQPVQASFDFSAVLLFIVSLTLFTALKELAASRLPKGYLPPLLFRKRLLQKLSFLQIFRN
jgi:hypothetical protein